MQPTSQSRTRRILMLPLVRIVVALAAMNLIALPFLRWLLPPGSALVLRETVLATAALSALLLIGRLIERREPSEFGLRVEGGARDLAIGFLLGAGIISVVIAIFAAAGWYRISSVGVDSVPSSQFPVALFLFLMVAVFEETLFRGIVFRVAEEGLGSLLSLALSASLFGLVHLGNPNATITASIAIAVEAGILLSAIYMLTRSLWMAIGVHWSWNFFEGPVFGTRVSGLDFPLLVEAEVSGPAWLTGGRFGPEAGLIALVVATAVGLYLLRRARAQGQWVRPAWVRRRQAVVTDSD